MGQHKTNPVALAAKRGELGPRPRDPKTGGSTMRSVLDIVVHGKRPYYSTGDGHPIRLRFPKVRGKAHVKRAKQARQMARRVAA